MVFFCYDTGINVFGQALEYLFQEKRVLLCPWSTQAHSTFSTRWTHDRKLSPTMHYATCSGREYSRMLLALLPLLVVFLLRKDRWQGLSLASCTIHQN